MASVSNPSSLTEQDKVLLEQMEQDKPGNHRGRRVAKINPKEIELKERKTNYCLMVGAVILVAVGIFLVLGLPFLGAGGIMKLDPLILFGVVPAGLILVALGGVCCIKSVPKANKDLLKKDKKTLEREKNQEKFSVEQRKKTEKKRQMARLGLVD